MIATEQVVSLIRSHMDNDDVQFRKIAMQIAASEAKAGHRVAASRINEALLSRSFDGKLLKLKSLNSDISDLVIVADKHYQLKDLVVSSEISSKIDRIIKEYMEQDKLHKYNLDNRRKLLLYGTSGTGKTMTAGILAQELNLPYIIVRTEKVVTKFMGETSLKLGKIFDMIADIPAVYLFDEFDAIGVQRGLDNEVGEQRRILNSFLQLLERDQSESIIIAATNNVEALDKALFRRFDDSIEYTLPKTDEIIKLLKETFCDNSQSIDIYALADTFVGMSHAEIKLICSDVMKESILDGCPITNNMIHNAIVQRRSAYQMIG